MPHLICKQCGAPYMGVFIDGEPMMCQVCSCEEFIDLSAQEVVTLSPQEDEE